VRLSYTLQSLPGLLQTTEFGASLATFLLLAFEVTAHVRTARPRSTVPFYSDNAASETHVSFRLGNFCHDAEVYFLLLKNAHVSGLKMSRAE
jgi:hypothetical protein